MSISRRHSRHEEEEEESAFISMTDMTVSILFIILILLAFFASQLRPEQEISRAEYDAMKIRLIERDGQLQETLKAVEALTNGAVDLDTVTLLQQQAEQATTLREEVEGLRDELARTYRLLAQKQANPLQVYNAAVAEVRVKLLTDLRDQIDAAFPELGVRLSGGRDALQFQGEGLFASGRASLSRDSRAKIEQIADMIDAALPCYTLGARAAYSPECNASFAVVEALQIEGHTDSDGSAPLNVQLSSLRAAATYEAMVVHEPRLSDHQNLLDQPVLSVAGYGEDRPVTENETTLGKSANRRIDLRFIMLRPARVEDIAQIENGLKQSRQP